MWKCRLRMAAILYRGDEWNTGLPNIDKHFPLWFHKSFQIRFSMFFSVLSVRSYEHRIFSYLCLIHLKLTSIEGKVVVAFNEAQLLRRWRWGRWCRDHGVFVDIFCRRLACVRRRVRRYDVTCACHAHHPCKHAIICQNWAGIGSIPIKFGHIYLQRPIPA